MSGGLNLSHFWQQQQQIPSKFHVLFSRSTRRFVFHKEFRSATKDKKKGLERSIADLETVISETKEGIEATKADIKALEEPWQRAERLHFGPKPK